jgi:hypothetical protein
MRDILSMCSPVIMYASNLGLPFDFSVAANGSHCSLSFSSLSCSSSGSCSGQLPFVRTWLWCTAGPGLVRWLPNELTRAPLLLRLSASPPLTDSRCFRTVALIFGSCRRRREKNRTGERLVMWCGRDVATSGLREGRNKPKIVLQELGMLEGWRANMTSLDL